MRDAVARGALGEVYLVDVRLIRQNGIPGYGKGYGSSFTNSDLAGHGALFDIGVHMLDLALSVLGFPEVVSVKGYLSGELGESRVGLGKWGIDRARAGRYDVDDAAAATVTLVGGGQIRHAHPRADRRVGCCRQRTPSLIVSAAQILGRGSP